MELQLHQMPAEHQSDTKQLPAKGIIHTMGEFIHHNGRIYSAKEWLDFIGLSVHLTITPTGVVCQHLPFDRMGAHAKGFNTNTVGIEFLLAGVWSGDAFRERIQEPYLYGDQYTAGIKTCKYLVKTYGMEFDFHDRIDKRIENGQKVKVDPGKGFPRDTFIQDIYLL